MSKERQGPTLGVHLIESQLKGVKKGSQLKGVKKGWDHQL